MSVQLDRKDTVSFLVYALTEILGPSGANLLGQYNLVSGTTIIGQVAAIQANYPRSSNQPVLEMIRGSGIECTVNIEPLMDVQRFQQNNRKSCKYYEFYLDQWDQLGGLTEAVEAVMTSNLLDIAEEPDIIPSIENKDGSGVLPPRAILMHRQAHFKSVSYG